jgi:hypothetical protein
MKDGVIFRGISKRSQITIFVIIAILIIGIFGIYFAIKNYSTPQLPVNIAPAYNYYLSCVAEIAKNGADIMASHGGYLENPAFNPGSTYAPFSSELGFMGLAIPYWYYISGNGVEKEAVPTKKIMQDQLAKYIEVELSNCDFSSFINQGYNITLGKASVKTIINDDQIEVSLNQKISMDYQDSNFISNTHSVNAVSNLGSYYNLARKIYDYQKNNLILENYTLDVLYTYAPVSGTLINCSPAIWSPYNIINDLKSALTANLQSIKLEGSYYTSKNSYTNYFITAKGANLEIGNRQVSFVYSSDWPSRFEIWPTENGLMKAQPIGNQAGLGVMGFCYIPYKFVYDIYIPVLVQIYNPDNVNELFQFPLAVVINKNVAKKAISSDIIDNVPNICDNANTDIQINTLNVNLNPVEADVEFKCFDDSCDLGKTKIDNQTGLATLSAKVPQCVNGILSAKSEGYSEKKQLMSTNEESNADLVLDREYSLKLEVYVDNVLTSDLAVLSINQNIANISNNAGSYSYPQNGNIKLSEGDYDFDLKIYGKGSINLPSTNTRQCVQTARGGILGLFGMEEEKCFDINVPGQTLTNILTAGGKQNLYITPDQLENSQLIRIYANSIPAPKNLDEVQLSYDEVSNKKINIEII